MKFCDQSCDDNATNEPNMDNCNRREGRKKQGRDKRRRKEFKWRRHG